MNNNNNRGNEIKNKIAKGAATVAGGPAAGKAVDLATKSKLGPSLNKNADLLSKQKPQSRANAGNLSKQAGGESLDSLPKGGLEDKIKQSGNSSSSSGSTIGKLKNKFGVGNKDSTSNLEGESEEFSNYGDAIFKVIGKYKGTFASVFMGFIIFIILCCAVYFGVASIGGTVKEFFTEIGDAIVGFFKNDEFDAQEQIKKYYVSLDNAKKNVYSSKGVCIDENLITATLTVDLDAFKYIKDAKEEEASEYAASDDYYANSTNEYKEIVETYKKMTKQVDVLANMQIKTIKYGNDKTLNYPNIGDRCKPEETGTETPLVTEENYQNFDTTPFSWLGLFLNYGLDFKYSLISDDPNIVSMHDKGGLFAFFSRKTNEEKNYEYHLYQPEATLQCLGKRRANGDCADPLKPVCNDKLPDDHYELSIGDLATMEQSVYYWNLVNQFIPEYYKEFLPDEGNEEYEDTVKKIAELIYLLYNDLGPGEECNAGQTYICRDDEGSSYYNAVNDTGGITVAGKNDFFDKISSIAIDEMTRTGIMSSVTMAQAALESSWGNSGLSKKYSNYYGMTAGDCASGLGSPSEHKGKLYNPGEGENKCTGNSYWNGTVVAACNKEGKDCQWYRVYDSFENSTKDHSRLLSNQSGRYAECNKYDNPEDQITCIWEAGYATDEKYVQKVMNMINKYNLSQYDIGQWDGTYTNPTGISYKNVMCYNPGDDGYGYGGGAGDWASWKQCDSRWGGLTISSNTICHIGCLMTSVAIQIARSGVPTTLGDHFNPGTFMQEHRAHGGFNGNLFNWDVTAVAPTFKYYGKVDVNNISAPGVIDNYIKQGYYVILNLHHPGEHHVAVDKVNGNQIYMFDPGNYGNEVYSAFNKTLTIDSIGLYKVG